MAAEQRVDRHYRSVLKLLKQEIVLQPERINTWLRLVNTARNIERIADHASKIAEAVVYLREGEILRHRPAADARSPSKPAPGPRCRSSRTANPCPDVIRQSARYTRRSCGVWLRILCEDARWTERRSKGTKPTDS